MPDLKPMTSEEWNDIREESGEFNPHADRIALAIKRGEKAMELLERWFEPRAGDLRDLQKETRRLLNQQ